jgi:hypothetical protein
MSDMPRVTGVVLSITAMVTGLQWMVPGLPALMQRSRDWLERPAQPPWAAAAPKSKGVVRDRRVLSSALRRINKSDS